MLIALSPNTLTRVGSVVFTVSALLLFTVSAIYHTGTWSPRTWAFLRRFDHSNVFILIAGSYTPFTLMLLEGTQRVALLVDRLGRRDPRRCCSGSSGPTPRAGSTRRSTSRSAGPRSSSSPASSTARSRLGTGLGIAAFVLIVVGGVLYTLGGAVYGFKFPNPSPRWFGFHEVFHSFTVLAFAAHYVGVSLATYSLR